MKLGKALAIAASAAAAVSAAVYVKKKIERENAPLRKSTSEENWVKNPNGTTTATIKKSASPESRSKIITEKIEKSKTSEASRENQSAPVTFDDVFDHFCELNSDGKTNYQDENIFEKDAPATPAEEATEEVVEETPEEVIEESAEEVVEETAEEAVEETAEEVVEEAAEEVVEETPEEVVEETAEEVVEETTEEVVEETAEEVVEETAEEVVEETTEEVVEEAAEEVVEETAEEVVEEAAEEVVEETAEEVVEETAEEVVEETTEEVVEETAEEVVEETAEEVVEETTEEVVEETAEEVVEEAAEEVVEETAEEVVEETTEEVVEEATEEVVEETAEEVVEETAEEVVEETPEEVVEETTEEVVEETTEEVVEETPEEVVEETAEEVVEEAAEEVIEEAAEEVVEETTEEVVEEATEEVVEETTEEVVEEATEEVVEENKKTMDFFDLPDETPAQEKSKVDGIASMEELFGDLLCDVKKEPEPVIDNPNEIFSMFNENENETDFDGYKDQKIEEEIQKQKTTDTRRTIAQDIADNIQTFARLLEPLNSVKENKIRAKSSILFDWEMSIQTLIGDLPIKTYWRRNFNNYEIWNDEKYIEKCSELISMMELAGIYRDNGKEVVITRDTMKFYSAQSTQANNDFSIGETAVVVRPCWRIDDKPVVMGEITKKAPFAEFSRNKMTPLEQMLRSNKCEDGDYSIPVTAENFCSYDRDIPLVRESIRKGVCKCAVRRMEDGTALAFFYEVIEAGDSEHYPECTLRFEITLDKTAKLIGRFKSEKV